MATHSEPPTDRLELASVLLDVDDSATEKTKDEIIDQLKLVDGVVFIFNFLDRGLRVAFYYEDEMDFERKTRLISSIRGLKDAPPICWKYESPETKGKLKKTDWEILKVLRKDPRKNVSDIAERLGVSARTVRRRLSYLIENNAFYILPVSNLKKSSGLAYYIVIFFADAQKKSQADELLLKSLPQISYVETNFQKQTVLAIISRNISEAEEVIQWLRGLNGVESVIFRIMKEIIPVHEWFDHEIEKHLIQ